MYPPFLSPIRSAAGGVRMSPTSLERQTPGLRRDELVHRVRPPGPRLVETNGRVSLQQGDGHLPKPLDSVGGREQRGIAAHRIQYQSLIRLEYIPDVPGIVHSELHAQLVQTHSGTGALAIERQGHFRGIRQVESQVVRALLADPGTGWEHALGRLPERYRNDSLPFGKALAGAQVEGYTCPAPIIDVAFQRNERLGIRIGGDPLF